MADSGSPDLMDAPATLPKGSPVNLDTSGGGKGLDSLTASAPAGGSSTASGTPAAEEPASKLDAADAAFDPLNSRAASTKPSPQHADAPSASLHLGDLYDKPTGSGDADKAAKETAALEIKPEQQSQEELLAALAGGSA